MKVDDTPALGVPVKDQGAPAQCVRDIRELERDEADVLEDADAQVRNGEVEVRGPGAETRTLSKKSWNRASTA